MLCEPWPQGSNLRASVTRRETRGLRVRILSLSTFWKGSERVHYSSILPLLPLCVESGVQHFPDGNACQYRITNMPDAVCLSRSFIAVAHSFVAMSLAAAAALAADSPPRPLGQLVDI